MRDCPICGGEIEEGLTTYPVDLKHTLIIVRKVPAEICSQCGSEWIAPNVTKKLQKITREAKEKKLELEIVAFEEAA